MMLNSQRSRRLRRMDRDGPGEVSEVDGPVLNGEIAVHSSHWAHILGAHPQLHIKELSTKQEGQMVNSAQVAIEVPARFARRKEPAGALPHGTERAYASVHILEQRR
jgi:hypothetical protein